MRSKSIAIFGSGLSAGYIRQACLDFGITNVDIYTNKTLATRTNLGHVLLRWVPPQFADIRASKISFFSIGSRDVYLARMKRYEDRSASKSAFPISGVNHLIAYDPQQTLNSLLPESIYGSERIEECTDEFIAETSRGYDHSFITFPLKIAEPMKHMVGYWAHTAIHPMENTPNHAIYNGTNGYPWLRYTCYWGVARWEYSHLEFPETEAAPDSPVASIPTKSVMLRDIAPNTPEYRSPIPKTTMVGRFAQLNKSVLAHDAYARTIRTLEQL